MFRKGFDCIFAYGVWLKWKEESGPGGDTCLQYNTRELGAEIAQA